MRRLSQLLKTIGLYTCLGLLLMVCVSGTAAAVGITIYPNSAQQGDEITLTVNSDMDMDQATYPVFSEPVVVVEGCVVSDIKYWNYRTVACKVVVPRNAAIGGHAAYVIADTNTATGAQSPVLSSSATFTIKSKPEIIGCAPPETYKGSVVTSLAVFGNYLSTPTMSGASELLSIIGGGVASSAITFYNSGSSATATGLSFASATPGSALKLYFVNKDGGGAYSTDPADGKATGLFTIYPQPAIVSVSPTSLYQTQKDVTIRLLCTGLHEKSIVVISTDNATPTTYTTSGGIDILPGKTTINAQTGEIAFIVNVSQDATIGDGNGTRYFWIKNPDGTQGSDNYSTSAKTITNFIGYKLTPTINTISPSSLDQGFSGEVTLTATGLTGNAFDDKALPTVTCDGTGVTVVTVSKESTTTVKLYVTVEPKAVAGARTLTITNPTYSVLKTTSITVNVSSYTRLGSEYSAYSSVWIGGPGVAASSTTVPTIYQGDVSTFTVTMTTGTSPTAYDGKIKFESGATAVVGGTGITLNKATTLGDGTTLWLLLTAEPKATVGQRTITIANPTYGVSTSFTINIGTGARPQELTLSTGCIEQGYKGLITISGTGRSFETTAVPQVEFSGAGVTVNNVIFESSTTIYAYITVDPTAATGQRTVKVTNPTFGTDDSCYVTITTSAFSNPHITTLDSVSTATAKTIYQNETYNITVGGTGFAPDMEWSISGEGVTLKSFVRVSSISAIITVVVSETAQATNYSLTLKNTNYQISTICQTAFRVYEKHQITSVSPGTLAYGTTEYFYINGSGFDPASSFTIFFDTAAVSNTPTSVANSMVFISSYCVSRNQISARVYIESGVVTGVHDLGVYFVSNGATVTKRGIITIPMQPQITSIPSTLSQGDTRKEVTIQGKNFEGGATIVISGSGVIISTTNVVSNNIMTFQCDVSKEAEKTTRVLKVINPTGQYAEGNIRVIAPPAITKCTPSVVLKGTTRYLEIEGDNFNTNFLLEFSGTVNRTTSTTSETAINLRLLTSGTTTVVGYAGSKQLFAYVYIGSMVVSGLHDIKVTNYDDSDPTKIEAVGLGAGLLNIRTPLRIDSAEGAFRLPAGIENKVVRIQGDGFSPTSVVTISGGDVEIVRTDFIGSREIEVVLTVGTSARISRRTVTITEVDGSSTYKQILDIIEPIVITEVRPKQIGIGLTYATMVVTGSGIDITRSTDPTGIVEVNNSDILNLRIDTTTISTAGFKIYFTVSSSATAGPVDVKIINSDNENITTKTAAFDIVESVKLSMVTPGYHQIGQDDTFSLRGSGYDDTNNYSSDGSTVTFVVGERTMSSYVQSTRYDQIVGTFTSSGLTASDLTTRNVTVTVINKDGTRAVYKRAIEMLEPLSITESKLYPTTIPMNATAATIHIVGTGLMPGATAYFFRYDSDGSTKILDEVITKKITYAQNPDGTTNDKELIIVVNTEYATEALNYYLVVRNPNNATYTSATRLLMVDNRPAINAITVVPASLHLGGRSESVTITGANFDVNGLTEVKFDKGISFTTKTVTATTITGSIVVPETTISGYANLEIKTGDATKTGRGENLLYILPAPSIDDVSPGTMYAEQSPASQLSIMGAEFDKGIRIIVTNIKETSNDDVSSSDVTLEMGDNYRQSDSRLQVNSISVKKEGTYSVKVINPDYSFSIKPGAIVVSPPALKAVADMINPSYINRGEKGKLLHISGSCFDSKMVIYSEGQGISVSSFVVISSQSATITADVDANATPGFQNFVFANPYAIKEKKQFFIAAAPEITSISPAAIQQNSTNIEVRIRGKNFLEKSAEIPADTIAVKITGTGVTVSSVTFMGSQQVNAVLTVSNNATPGDRDVVVVNPCGVQSASGVTLRIVAPISVTKITPAMITQGDTNKRVVIQGTGFEDGAQVTFGGTGVTVNKVTFIDDTQLDLDVTVSNTATSPQTVRVTNANGTKTNSDGVTIISAMKVTSTNPSKLGRQWNGLTGNEGVLVEVKGVNFASNGVAIDPASVSIAGTGVTVNTTTVILNGDTSFSMRVIVDENAPLGARNVTFRTTNQSTVVGESIVEIIDAVNVRAVTPASFTIYPHAFTIYNDSPTYTSATIRVDVSSITLKTYFEGIERQVFPIAIGTNTITGVVSDINGIGPSGDGWHAAVVSSRIGQLSSGWLSAMSATNAYGTAYTQTLHFASNLYTISVDGSGFYVGTTTPTLSVSGSGVTVLSTATNVTSNLALTSTIKINPAIAKAGVRDFTVINPDGSIGKGLGLITLADPLTISTCVPVSVGRGATESTVRVTGAGFITGIRADVANPASGAELVGTLEYIGSEEVKIKVKISAAFSGSVSTITLTNTNGDAATLYLTVDDIPVILRMDPSHLAQGAGATASSATVTMYGIDLSTNIVIAGNGVTLTTATLITSTCVVTGIRIQKNAATGKRAVIVTDASSKKGQVEDVFEITAAPTLLSIAPNTILPDTTASLDIRGTGLETGLLFSLTARSADFSVLEYNYVNSERSIVKVYVSSTALPGTYDVTLTNPDQSTAVQFGFFTISETQRTPFISNITPALLGFGVENQEVLITGTDFEQGAAVTFSGSEITVSSTVWVSKTQLRLKVSVASKDPVTPGCRQVRVTNPSGKTYASDTLFQLIVLPSVESMQPESLTQGTTAVVFINGKGFTTGSTIEISGATGVSLGTVRVVGSSQLQCTIGVATTTLAGKHDITVVTSNGYGLGAGLFKVVAPLKIDSVSPATVARAATDKDVWISGTGFDSGVRAVIQDGITIKETKYISETLARITLTVDASAALGTRSITLYNSNGAKYEVSDLLSVIPQVVVTEVDPSLVGVGVVNKQLTITGAQFKAGASVTIGGLGATVTGTTVNSDSQITVTVTLDATATEGTRDITVTNSDTNEGVGKNLLRVQEVVAVNMIEPSYVTLRANTTYQAVVLRGSGFDVRTEVNRPTVTFSGAGLSISTTSISVVSSGELRATLWIDTTVARTGEYCNVTMQNPDGTIGTGKRLFLVNEPIAVTRAVPNSLGRGAQKETINIIGNGFVKGADVAFSHGAISVGKVDYVSAQQLDAEVTIDLAMDVGYATFTVTNPGGESTATWHTFSVTQAPVVYRVAPSEYAQGATSQSLIIYGNGFVVGSSTASLSSGVRIISSEVADVTNGVGKQMNLVVSVDKVATTSSRDVIVVSNNQQGIGRGLFTVTDAPAIFSVSPATLNQTKQEPKYRTLEITGRGFVNGSTVTFSPATIPVVNVTYVNKERLNVQIDVSEGATATGTYGIQVTNPDGSVCKADAVFVLNKPPDAPVCQSIAPNYLAPKTAQQNVVISGSNLQQNIVASFSGGGIHVTSSTVTQDSGIGQVILSLTVDEDAPIGKRDITLTNPDGGTATFQDKFQIIAIPKITKTIPSYLECPSGGSASRQFSVQGTAFLSGSVVEVTGGGIIISSSVYLGSTELIVYATVYSTASSGARDVVVKNPTPDGSIIIGLGAGLISIAAPAGIGSVSPAKLARGDQHRAVTIRGSGFQDGVSVSFGGAGITVEKVQFFNETQISVLVSIASDAELTQRSVSVTNPTGLTTQKSNVLLIGNAVEVSALNPSTIGRGVRNKTIVVTGNNFSTGITSNTVRIEGSGIVVSTVQTTTSERSITITVTVSDDAPLGSCDVVVTNGDGSSGTGKDFLTITDQVSIAKVDPQYIQKNTVWLSSDNATTNIIDVYLRDGDNADATVSVWGSSMTLHVVGGTNAGDYTLSFSNSNAATLTALCSTISSISGEAGCGSAGWSATLKNSTYASRSPKYLARASNLQCLGSGQKATLKGVTFKKTFTISGKGFDTTGTTPAVEVSGIGITTYSASLTSSVELTSVLVVDVEQVGAGSYDLAVRNADGTMGKKTAAIQFVDELSISTCTPSVIGNTNGTAGETIHVLGTGFIAEGLTVEKAEGTSGITISNVTWVGNNEITFTATASNASPANKALTIRNTTGNSATLNLRVDDIPVVTSVTPAELPQSAGGTSSLQYATLTVTGVGFAVDASTQIQFHDSNITVAQLVSQSDTQIVLGVRIDRGAVPGKRNIEIVNKVSNGKTGISYNVFSIIPAPTITSINPDRLTPDTTVMMEIKGSGFSTGSRIVFGNSQVDVRGVNFMSSDRLLVQTFTRANAVSGVYNVSVYDTNLSSGTGYGMLTVVVNPPTPIITSIAPTRCARAQTNILLQVNGSNFEAGAAVFVAGGGVSVSSTTVYPPSIIQASINIDDQATAGFRTVTVTNPTGKTSEITAATVIEVTALPDVTAMSPESLTQGTTDIVFITGTNFSPESVVSISLADGITITSTTVIGTTQIRLEVEVSARAVSGSHDVSVFTNSGSGTGKGVFKIVAPIGVSSVSPSSIAQGETDRTISVKGDGFDSTARVSISGGGVTVSNVSANAQEIICKVTVTNDAAVGNRDIVVTNGNGATARFEAGIKIAHAVVVNTVQPNSVGIGVSSKTITIGGSGFELVNGATPTVRVGGIGVTVTSVTFNSANELVAVVNVSTAATAGARSITVTNADGNVGKGTDLLSLQTAVNVGSVDPAYKARSTSADTDIAVVMRGTGFDTSGSTPTLTFSGSGISVISSTAPTSSTEMYVTLRISTTAAIGARDITLVNSDGTQGTGKAVFRITEPLQVTQADPSSLGKGADSQLVSIKGKGFVEGAQISFADPKIKVNSTLYRSSEQLDIYLSLTDTAIEVGYTTFTILNANRTDTVSSSSTFRVTLAPVVNTILETTNSYGQGAQHQTVIIRGSNFSVNNTTVTFEGGGVMVESTTVDVSSTVITVVVSIAQDALPITRDIVVKSDGNIGRGKSLFTVIAAPTIQKMTPNSVVRGWTRQDIDIEGSGFGSGGGVNVGFSCVDITTVSVVLQSAQRLRVGIAISTIVAEGAYDVTVLNKDGSTGVGKGVFTVYKEPLVPYVFNVSPQQVHQGQGLAVDERDQNGLGQEMLFAGQSFAEGAMVAISGGGVVITSTISVLSEGQIKFRVKVDKNAPVGQRSITVTNTNGGTYTLANALEVIATPSITKIEPASIDKGETTKEVTTLLTGTGFATGATLSVSGTGIMVSSVTYIGSTQIECTLVVYSSATIGAHDLTVSNPFGVSGIGPGMLKIVNPLVVDDTKVTKIPQNVNNRTVTITGGGFIDGATVLFSGGGISVLSVKWLSERELGVTVNVASDAQLGQRTVTVTNPNNTTATSAKAIIEIIPPIVVSSVEPSQIGRGLAQATLTVRGSGFEDGATVDVSGSGILLSTYTTFLSANEVHIGIIKVADDALRGLRDVVVTNSNGEKGSGRSILDVVAGVTVDALSPSYMVQASTRTISIRGKGFSVTGSTPTVTISGTGVTISSIEYVSSVELRASFAVASDGVIGARDITVTNADGTIGKGVGIFEIAKPLIVRAIDPIKLGRGARSDQVKVLGTGFVKGAQVRFGNADDVTVQNISYISSEELNATVSVSQNASPGQTHIVKVTNVDGSMNSETGITLTVDTSPVITSVLPASLSQGAIRQTVVIDGFNIEESTRTTVAFSDGGIIISSWVVHTSSITTEVTIEKGATIGKKSITITNRNGIFGIGREVFEVTAAPTVQNSDPPVLDQGTTTTISIYGTGFKVGASVSFNNANLIVLEATYISANRLVVKVDATRAEVRSYDVTVTNTDGSNGTGQNIVAVVKPPTISACNPRRVSQGSVDHEVAIAGMNFERGAVVSFNGGGITISTYNVISTNQIVVKLTISQDAALGKRTVVVTNPSNSNTGASGESKFEITPKPVVTKVDPSTLIQGATSWITLTGTGFYNGIAPDTAPVSVAFSGQGISVSSVQFLGSTQIKVYVQVAQDASTGNRDVFVSNADATLGIGAGLFATVAPIEITSMDPSRVPQSATHKAISIRGKGFVTGANVQFAGTGITVESTNVLNDAEMTTTITVAADATKDIREVTITNTNGTSSKLMGVFTIIDPIVIGSVDPKEIGQGATNKTVLINGSGFTEGAKVEVSGGGVTVTTTSYSVTQIVTQMTVATNATIGEREIVITNSDGNKQTAKLLTITSAVTIASIDPSYMVLASSGWITIKGSGFLIDAATPTVTISGTSVSVTTVTAQSTSELRAFVVALATASIGARDVTVQNYDGTIGKGNGAFTITKTLEVTSLDPSSLGKGAADYAVAIRGNGFVKNATVSFTAPGITVKKVDFIGNEQLNVTIDIAATASSGVSDVIVTNPNNTSATGSGLFTITEAPVVTGVSPNKLAQGATLQKVYITGVNIQKSTATTVRFSNDAGITVSSVTVVDTTTITVYLTLDKGIATAGTRDITINNANGLSGTGKALFTIAAAPSITSLSPKSLDQGATGKEVYVEGTGFMTLNSAVPTVDIRTTTSIVTSVTYISETRLMAKVTIPVTTPQGTYDVVVTNPDGSSATGTALFEITPPPQITNVSPLSLNRGTENQDLTIFGSNFQTSAAVAIDGAGIKINSTKIVASGQIIINITIASDAPVGGRTLTVTNPNGSMGSGKNLFTVAAAASMVEALSISRSSITYERVIELQSGTTVYVLNPGTTISYTLNTPADRVDCAITKLNGEQVRLMSLYNAPTGTHASDGYQFWWDGSIPTVKENTEQEMSKMNGEFVFTVTGYASNSAVAVKSTNTVTVDVVNISNVFIQYTELGSINKVKVSPYTIVYNISKAAYNDITIYSSTGTLVRSFSSISGKQGRNTQSWDGRNENGTRLAKGMYTVKVNAHSDAGDYAIEKTVTISADPLKLIDVAVQPMQAGTGKAIVSFIAAEAMNVTLRIYKPGTEFSSEGEPLTVTTLVKTMTAFLDRGTSYWFEWDGRDEKGVMVVDGDYVYRLTGRDGYGNIVGDKLIGSLAIRRADSIDVRKEMFKNNSYPYPNPVDADTASSIRIKYGLNKTSDIALRIYDIVGGLVWEKMQNGVFGEGSIEWNLTNVVGAKVERGVYVYVMEATETDNGAVLRTANKIMVIRQ